MTRLGTMLAVTTLVAGLACTEKGRSIVLVDLTSTVVPLESVRLVAARNGANVGQVTASWNVTSTPTPPLKLGILVSKDVSGPITVYACGFNAGAGVAATSVSSIDVQPGGSVGPVDVELGTGSLHALCADGGAGGTGGSTGGTGGSTGGSGGGTAGSGGMGGGTAGSAGGSAGTGGSAGGTGGTMGVAGSPGGAGGSAGGSAGAGGRGGSGGSGGGGTGGGQVAASWRGAMGVAVDPGIIERMSHVAVDKNGNAVLIYQHGGEIWTNYYNATTTAWGPGVILDMRAGTAAQEPYVAVDKNGAWLAIWAQNPNDTLRGIYTSTSTNGTTWSAISALTNTTSWAPSLGMNEDGAALVAWTESVGNNWQVAAATRQVTGSAWTPPTVLRPGNDNGDRDPVAVVSGAGEGFVLWTQDDTAGYISVWLGHHTQSGWQPAALFETNEAANAYAPALAANKAGNVIGTYIQVASTTMQLWTRRYTPGAGFAAAQRAAEAPYIEWLSFPSVTLDESGVATAAWAQTSTQSGTYQVHVNRAAATDAAWPAAMAMETDNAAAADDPNSSIARSPMPIVRNDPAGNVTLLWRKRTGARFDLYARRLPVGGTWGTPALLETRDTYSVFYPALGVGANGNAVAVWYYATELDVWANVYR